MLQSINFERKTGAKTRMQKKTKNFFFLSKLKNTFWVVQPDYEAQLNQLQLGVPIFVEHWGG